MLPWHELWVVWWSCGTWDPLCLTKSFDQSRVKTAVVCIQNFYQRFGFLERRIITSFAYRFGTFKKIIFCKSIPRSYVQFSQCWHHMGKYSCRKSSRFTSKQVKKNCIIGIEKFSCLLPLTTFSKHERQIFHVLEKIFVLIDEDDHSLKYPRHY